MTRSFDNPAGPSRARRSWRGELAVAIAAFAARCSNGVPPRCADRPELAVCQWLRDASDVSDATDIGDAPLFITGLAAGAGHTCVLLSDTTVRCWGCNLDGQLGDGPAMPPPSPSPPSPSPVLTSPTTSLRGVTELALGQRHSCALVGQYVYCWGFREGFWKGPNTRVEYATAIRGFDAAASIAAGYRHTCAVTLAGGVHCGGYNTDEQIGEVTSPNMGDTTFLSRVQRVAAGEGHTCAVLIDGRVACWGRNRASQLGANRDGGASPSFVGLTVSDAGIRMLAAGQDHSCALIDGKAWCWGFGANGRLGAGEESRVTPRPLNEFTDFVQLAAGAAHTCGLRSGGEIQCWGAYEDGQRGGAGIRAPLRLGSELYDLIAAGAYHTCGVRRGRKVVDCWGYSGVRIPGEDCAFMHQPGAHTIPLDLR